MARQDLGGRENAGEKKGEIREDTVRHRASRMGRVYMKQHIDE